METKIYRTDQINQAAALLRQGELVAFPTETVYGLGANALLPESVKRVFTVKGRPSDNPLIVHVSNFWPGPLTLIFSIKAGSLSTVVTGGLSTAAFRMPDNKKTLSLIEKTGAPLVGPSANTSGKPSPTTAMHVFHDLKGKIAGILDDGATQIGVESTVLDLSGEVPTILRPGAVTKEKLEEVLGIEVPLDKHLVKESETPKAPGMKYKHYSPDVSVLMIKPGDWGKAIAWADTNGKKVGLLATPKIADSYPSADRFVFEDDSIEAATRGLFSGLRALDEANQADIIFAEVFPEDHLGLAYMNRLKKAAAQKYFGEK